MKHIHGLTASVLIVAAGAWDVARTPPMGFNTWNLYHCSVDATILTETATSMVDKGLKDAGYIYVNRLVNQGEGG
jgi:alpha-galactosidase